MDNKGQKPAFAVGKLKMNGLAVFVLSLLTTAAVAQKTVIKSDETKDRVIVTNGNKTWKHTSSNGLSSFNIEYKGSIDVTDDDKDVKSISPGGYLEISKTTFGSKREITIESTSGGSLRREYYEGRTKTPWEPDGKNWLAEILPEIVRSTGIAAQSRVDRYYKRGGVDAVLNELERLEGDYVIAIYSKLLLKKDNLSNNDLKKAIKGIGDELNSDYYLSEVLKDNSDKFLKNDDTAETYFDAVQHISSDYYATVVLKSAMDSYKPSPESLAKIMSASRNIGSDYYQASLLSRVLELDNLNGELIGEIIKTTKDVSSDYYQTQVLTKAIETKGLSSESFNSLLDAISDVSSDYYMATVFSKLADNKLDEDVIVKIVKLVNDKMSSDYYAASVLSKLMKKQQMSSRSVEAVASGIGNLGSSNYAAEVIKSISDNDNLSKDGLLSIIKSIDNISSDYYAASALGSIAPLVRNSDNEVKEAYRNAAKNIHSDTYYGKAMRALE